MPDQARINVEVNIVENPSLNVEKAIVTLTNQSFTSAYQLRTYVQALCSGQPHRIYWRVTELDYLPIIGYIELKAALSVMNKPGIYVIQDEPFFMLAGLSDENFARVDISNVITGLTTDDDDDKDNDSDLDYDVSSLLGKTSKGSSKCSILEDLEILRCAMNHHLDERRISFDCLLTTSRPMFTRETRDIDRQFEILNKGFPEAKATRPVEISFAETKKINSAGTSNRGGARKTSDDFKTANDVKESTGEEPIRAEGRLDEITNTWRDVKRALSLLYVKTFSSNAAMLEAPPGSREDLVEAARTPCTPTDLDTMLYGYTNSIYVLDHTPEALPDMDMLQLFASPAGRALVTGDNRPSTRGGSTSTSLSRESLTRAKSRRRASSTVGIPTPPPRQRKSSAELYKEAVEILGLTCSLTDSCRCLDCQSNYFDCDDDCGDARSELAAGTPILLDHALSHPLACSIQ